MVAQSKKEYLAKIKDRYRKADRRSIERSISAAGRRGPGQRGGKLSAVELIHCRVRYRRREGQT